MNFFKRKKIEPLHRLQELVVAIKSDEHARLGNPYRDDPLNARALDLLEQAMSAKTLRELGELQNVMVREDLLNHRAPAEHAAWYLEGYISGRREQMLTDLNKHGRVAHRD